MQKASGLWRAVIYFLFINNYVTLNEFRMETISLVFGSIRNDNMKDNYFQILDHASGLP